MKLTVKCSADNAREIAVLADLLNQDEDVYPGDVIDAIGRVLEEFDVGDESFDDFSTGRRKRVIALLKIWNKLDPHWNYNTDLQTEFKILDQVEYKSKQHR